MAITITGERLKRIVKEGEIIRDGALENCGAIKYDFLLSDDFLKADYGVPTKISELEPEKKADAVISPGEVVFVLSKETVSLPKNMFMHLSANRGMSEYGILTLGGFAVDPNYTGRLLFGLYNYSSTPFILMPGKKLIGAVFYELEDNELNEMGDHSPPRSIDSFSPRLVSIIKQYSPTGLSALEDSIEKIRTQFELVKKEQSDHEKRTQLQQSEHVKAVQERLESIEEKLREHNYSIDDVKRLVRQAREDLDENNRIVKTLSNSVQQLSDGLQTEVRLRQQLDLDVTLKIEETKKETNDKVKFFKGALWLATAFGAVVFAFLIAWIAGWLNI